MPRGRVQYGWRKASSSRMRASLRYLLARLLELCPETAEVCDVLAGAATQFARVGCTTWEKLCSHLASPAAA
ncbi:hypothetical protein NDU88_006794 [Pleurodeles waltl]|uniref:Uncharacterized protein n=1 Tax=Pleurodeles waltl TaxID=8319 RepID=A0AAV7RR51_PLEWA|nr:hypothetical protein NDU88_006794 [Pleurodeles waltl]